VRDFNVFILNLWWIKVKNVLILMPKYLVLINLYLTFHVFLRFHNKLFIISVHQKIRKAPRDKNIFSRR